MSRYTKNYAERLLDAYIEEIRDIRSRLWKQLSDMDLENADVYEDLNESVQGLQLQCDMLMWKIEEEKRHLGEA